MKIELEEALELIKANIAPIMKADDISILDAAGRVCAEDVKSPICVPPFDNSPLDGYALRAEDSHMPLEVIDSITAGMESEKALQSGQAIALTTGCPMPKGADCVVAQEKTKKIEGKIKPLEILRPFQNFRKKGEDVDKGDIIIKKGQVIDHIKIGMIASCGMNMVKVYGKPKVAVLATGDELWPRWKGPLPAGKIYSSNDIMIYTRIKELGADMIKLEAARDDKEDLAKAIVDIAKDVDLLITTGGVSVGVKDLMPEVMKDIGAKTIFHGINIKPGSVAMFSRYDEMAILSLSGNPRPAAITLELLARPILAAMMQNKDIELTPKKAIMQGNFEKISPSRRFVSGIFPNALLDIPSNSPPLRVGSEVTIWMSNSKI
ncbi:MAG: molybdopterin molybdotransferase MoeA [Defluviitaleaceae bacterium]|nr:molybdopterin molybdotransferase MoeA [Defluviitaleaceae bacterium]